MRKLVLALSLSLAVTACSKKEPEEQMVAMMEDLGSAIDNAKGDCGKMADGVEAVSKKYDLKEMKESAEKMKSDKERSKKMMEKYGDRLQKVMPKLMGMMKCADDPKMKAVEAKLKGVM